MEVTHIEIFRLKTNPGVYYNRKGFHSINFLCAIGANMKFRFISFGYGSAHDSRIYGNFFLNIYGAEINNQVFHFLADYAFNSLNGILISTNSEINEL